MPDQPELPFAQFPMESHGVNLTTTSVEVMLSPPTSSFRAAEFFAGIGLVRMALERVGIEVVWANDIEPIKERMYSENFGPALFHLGDVRQLRGVDLPDVDVATASFPCTDLSLAGWRRGLAGAGSGMFWEFARVLEEMGERRPSAILLENVPGFATSHGGADLRAAVERLNELGYWCDASTGAFRESPTLLVSTQSLTTRPCSDSVMPSACPSLNGLRGTISERSR